MKKPLKLTSRSNLLLKFDLKMKLSALFVLITFFTLQANDAYSQRTKISLDLTNVSVSRLLDEIESNSDFRFIYKIKDVGLERKVTINVKKKRITEILNQVFVGTKTKYNIIKERIYLTELPNRVLRQNVEPISPQITQQSTINGTVTDGNGGPLPGASIVEKGTTNGTQTDFDGNFTLDVTDENAILVISYLGFASKEVLLNGKSTLNISLAEDAQGLDEVVVVGYGAVKKSDLTGAVTSVKAEDLSKTVSPTPQQALAGRAAGVNITQNNATPGASSSISIRGGGSPLFVIDGLPVSGGVSTDSGNRYGSPAADGFNFVNPNDVASIEILKDAASTAIYGARGANGVVLITTKSGREGKPTIDFSSKVGISTLVDDAEMLNARQYAEESNRYRSFIGQQHIYSDSEIQSFGEGTNWLDEITKSGVYSDNNLSIRGGSDKFSYYSSINLLDQNGVIKESDFKRTTGRINLRAKGEKYRIDLRSTFAIQKRNAVSSNTGALFQNAGALQLAREFLPTIPIRDANGDFALNRDAPFLSNPVSLLDVTDIEEKNKFISALSVEYDFFDGFFAKLEYGFEKEFLERSTYVPRTTLVGRNLGGQGFIGDNTIDNTRIFASLNYIKTFSEYHSVNALLGTERQTTNFRSKRAGGSQFPTDALLFNNLNLAQKETQFIANDQSETRWLSYLGRLNYSFRNKYLFTGTFRYDGSANFRAGNRFLFYPSFSVGWALSEENFIDSDAINNLKLRASWGQTGRDNIGLDDTYALLNLGTLVFGNTTEIIASQDRLINEDLEWQVDDEFNIGLDYGLFNNRINGSFEFFRKNRNNILADRTLDPDKGFTSVKVNQGKQRNVGWEFTINGKIFNKGPFLWETSFNVFKNTWRWVERTNDDPLLFRNENDPLNAIYAYQVDGVIRDVNGIPAWLPDAKPGVWNYADLHGRDANDEYTEAPDGVFNSVDQRYMGTSVPKWNWGFTSNMSYKRIGLNVSVQAMMDWVARNQFKSYFGYPQRLLDPSRNMLADVIDRWSPDNPNAPLASGEPSSYDFAATNNNYFIEDATFVRIRNITLTYDLPIEKLNIPISRLNLYIDAQNPFLFTKFSFVDPETATNLDPDTGEATGSRDPYPNTRAFILGLDITF